MAIKAIWEVGEQQTVGPFPGQEMLWEHETAYNAYSEQGLKLTVGNRNLSAVSGCV